MKVCSPERKKKGLSTGVCNKIIGLKWPSVTTGVDNFVPQMILSVLTMITVNSLVSIIFVLFFCAGSKGFAQEATLKVS